MLQRVWIIPHSMAHNGGFVTGHDAYRLQAPTLREAAIAMELDFLEETIRFLRSGVEELNHGQPISDRVIAEWLNKKATGNWTEDEEAYGRVGSIVTVVRERTHDIPTFTRDMYDADRGRLVALPAVTRDRRVARWRDRGDASRRIGERSAHSRLAAGATTRPPSALMRRHPDQVLFPDESPNR